MSFLVSPRACEPLALAGGSFFVPLVLVLLVAVCALVVRLSYDEHRRMADAKYYRENPQARHRL